MILWRSTRSSKTNTKRSPFHHRGLEYQSRKSRDTCSNRQIWPWSTKWSRTKANRVLPREHTGHSKHPLPTTQETTLHMDITRWSIPKLHWFFVAKGGEAPSLLGLLAKRSSAKMEKPYPVSKNKTRSWQWLRSWTPYHKIQTEIEEQKITRPFRYDLNQMPYNYTVW